MVNPVKHPRRPEHRVALVSYRDNRIVCSCGAEMPAYDDRHDLEARAWNAHRAEYQKRVPEEEVVSA